MIIRPKNKTQFKAEPVVLNGCAYQEETDSENEVSIDAVDATKTVAPPSN